LIEAADKIMKGEATNAFCAVRPPGHHAGVFGRTNHPDDEYLSEPEALTNGFCFINNVAVAAAYLKHMYRD